MATIKWRKDEAEKPTRSGEYEFGPEVPEHGEDLLRVAQGLAEEIGGKLMSLFAMEPGTVTAVMMMDEGGLSKFTFSDAARSLDDLPDVLESDDYVFGLELALELDSIAEFSSDKGEQLLMTSLMNYDRKLTTSTALKWAELLSKRLVKPQK